MALYIHDQNYFVPESFYNLESPENISLFGLDERVAQVYLRLYGLKNIPVAKDMTLESMIIKAITPLLKDDTLVDYLINTHTMPGLVKPSYSIIRNIKNRFSLNEAEYFSSTMTRCVSLIKSLEILNCLMQNDKKQQALIFSGDKVFTNEYRVMPNITIASDAASAMLVSNKRGHSRLISTAIHTYGKYAKGIWMNTAELSDFGSNFNPCMLKAINDSLNKGNIKLEDVKVLLPHNVNLHCWRSFSSYCKFPMDRIYLKNVSRFAHCYGSDLIINLQDMLSDGLLQPGDYFIKAMVAVGAVYGVALFQYLGHENEQRN